MRDMPTIMYGSGDKNPVDPQAAQFLSELTVQFISELVDSAVDAQHHACGTAVQPMCPPPPPLPKSRSTILSPMGRKRKSGGDYYDEALPEPKIKGTNNNTNNSSTNDDNWVGVQGVDLHSVRSKHVGGPALLSTQHFIFPICHDTYTYGKVMHLQSAKRSSILPAITEPTWLEMVRTEGHLPHHNANAKEKKKESKKKDDDADDSDEQGDDDEEESSSSGSDEEGDNAPTWPGVQDLVPIHRARSIL